MAFSWVALTNVVTREVVTLLGFIHCTTEQGRIFVPFTLSVIAGVPAAADVCDSETIVGAARGDAGVDSVKVKEEDVPTEFVTDTAAVPGNADRAAEIGADNCVALTKVVV